MLEKHFKLCRRKLVKYATSFKNTIFLKPNRGCATSFDDTSKKVIVEMLSGLINTTTASNGMLLNTGAESTASRHNVVPHRSTKFHFGKQLDVNSGVGEEIIPARAIATRSTWNVVSFAAMNCAMRSLVVVHVIANIDASQFKVGNRW